MLIEVCMKYMYACQTDIGISRSSNQDSLIMKTIKSRRNTALLAAVCDGVGGLSKGEVTSRKTVKMLGEWADYELPCLLEQDKTGEILRRRFRQQLMEINREIFYGNKRSGIESGTTLTALVMWNYRYLLGHVGDSRAYAITRQVRQLTTDHSWVAQEVAAGRITAEEAEKSAKKNVILKCIGADETLEPQVEEGQICEDTVFLLCTDGFWHHIAKNEWLPYFSPERIHGEELLRANLFHLFSQVKCRGENDNITAAAIKVFRERK